MIVNLLLLVSLLAGFGGEDIGTSALPILREGFGPRAAALGESFVALSDDATAPWWNPAGLGYIEKNYIFCSHQELFLDTRDEYISGILLTPYGKFSLSVIYSGIDNVESWTESEEELSPFNTSTTIAHLGFGEKITDKFSIGAGIKGIYDNLKTVDAKTACLDIGFIYELVDWVSFGLNLQNLGPSVNYITKKVPLPTSLRSGFCLKYHRDVVYLLDINIPEQGKIELHSGFEYTLLNILSLRAGLRTGPQNRELGFFTYGAGINWHALGIDYAFIPYSLLGSTHRVSLSYSFPSHFTKKKKLGVTILVADASTHTPLKARIRFEGAFEGKEWTDIENGAFRRESFPEGETKITVEKKGYATVYDSFSHKKNKYTEIKVMMRKPMPSAIIGVIYDAESKKPISGTIDFSGPLSGNIKTKKNGNYEIGYLTQGKYILSASSFNYINQTEKIYVGSGELKEKSFYLIKSEGSIILKNIFFDTGKANLREEAFEVMNSIGKALEENPSYKLKIEGHTDIREIHTTEFPSNWELSKARAKSSKEYIIIHFDVESDRITTEGFADTKPAAPNDTEENLQKNRRVEFTIIK